MCVIEASRYAVHAFYQSATDMFERILELLGQLSYATRERTGPILRLKLLDHQTRQLFCKLQRFDLLLYAREFGAGLGQPSQKDFYLFHLDPYRLERFLWRRSRGARRA